MIEKSTLILTALIVGIGHGKDFAILCANVNQKNDSLRNELSRKVAKNDSTLNFCRTLFETKYLNNVTEAKNDRILNECRSELKKSNDEIISMRNKITECVDSLTIDSAEFKFDPNQRFELKYARYRFGFAWKYGHLDTNGYYELQVERDGNIVNNIRTKKYCKNRSNLSLMALRELSDSIKSNNIADLPKRYIENEVDGSNLILSIKQGKREKNIFTQNYRPKEIINILRILENRNYEETCGENFSKFELFDNGKNMWRLMHGK